VGRVAVRLRAMGEPETELLDKIADDLRGPERWLLPWRWVPAIDKAFLREKAKRLIERVREGH
jgi:hypothetical protein